MSRAIGRRWYEDTRAAEETEGVLSTIAVLMFRSIAWTVDACSHDQHSTSLLIPCILFPYINDPAKRSYSVGPVHHIAAHRRGVLHDTARDHDDILRRVRQLFDDKVDHLPERGILVLEQFADSEEEGGGLVGGKLLAGEEEERDLGEEDAAFTG